MGISNIRTIEVRRNSDNYLVFDLTTPDEDKLAAGHSLGLSFFHDNGEEDAVLLSNEEASLLFEALDDWLYGV